MNFTLPRSKFPVLSSYRGKITRILLVDDDIYKEGDFYVLQEHEEIIAIMAADVTKSIHFDILVEFDFQISEPEDENYINYHREMRAKICACYHEKLKTLSVCNNREYGGTEGSLDSGSSYTLLFPNLDGRFIIRQFQETVGTIKHPRVGDLVNLYRYIQDPFLAIIGPEGVPGILEPYYHWPTNRLPELLDGMLYTWYIPDMLSSLSDYVCRSSPFLYQGGDVLVGNDYALVSRKCLKVNWEKYREGLVESSDDSTLVPLMEEMANSFGLSYVICPDFEPSYFSMAEYTPPQIFFHLDLFVTLAGKTTDGSELVLVGELYEWKEALNDWCPVDKEDPRQIYLNNYAICLQHLGHPSVRFHVERIPLFWEKPYLYSYNNCLVEIDSTGWKGVILPEFGSDPFESMKYKLADHKAYKVWETLGFAIRKVKGSFTGLASEKAGLRCIVNVVARQR